MLGEKLRELRTELNLNMKQASEKLGISYTTYVGYEKNEREPNSETLIKLADFYKCSVLSSLSFSPSIFFPPIKRYICYKYNTLNE